MVRMSRAAMLAYHVWAWATSASTGSRAIARPTDRASSAAAKRGGGRRGAAAASGRRGGGVAAHGDPGPGGARLADAPHLAADGAARGWGGVTDAPPAPAVDVGGILTSEDQGLHEWSAYHGARA